MYFQDWITYQDANGTWTDWLPQGWTGAFHAGPSNTPLTTFRNFTPQYGSLGYQAIAIWRQIAWQYYSGGRGPFYVYDGSFLPLVTSFGGTLSDRGITCQFQALIPGATGVTPG